MTNARTHTLALLGYLALALLLLAPVLPAFTTAIPGGPVARIDGWQHVWHLWWAGRAITAGQSPFFTEMLYHPLGVSLAVHPLNLSNGLIALPVTLILGPIAGFNAALVVALTLSGYGAFLLARHVGGGGGAAFVAGLLFTCAPYHLTKLWDGQLELVAMQWLPLYALFLLRSAERPGWRDPLLAGVFLAITGYTSLYYLLFLIVYTALFFLLWLPWRAGWRAAAHWSGRAAAIGIIAGLLLWPIVAPALGSAGALGTSSRLNPLLIARSANLLDFLLPSYLHPLWGPWVAQLGPRWHPDIQAWNVALGYTAIGLAVLACLRCWGRSWRWLALALAGVILALGPRLSVGDWRSDLPMPYALLLELPGLRLAQRPGHFVALTVLALVPLTALGMQTAEGRRQRAEGKKLQRGTLPCLPQPAPFILPLLLLALIELLPPALPLNRPGLPPAYADLAGRPGAIMLLPEEPDNSFSLQGQLIHGRPLVGGYLARTPPNPFAERTPVVRPLWRMQPEPPTLILPEGADPSVVLRGFGIGDLVVHWARMTPEQRAAAPGLLAMALPGVAPAYNDGDLSVYPVPPGPVLPFASFGPGWYREETDGARRWRWMAGAGEIWLVNPADRPVPISLQLTAESYLNPRVVDLALGAAPLGRWEVPAQPATATRALRLLLPPGEHTLRLSAPAAPEATHRGPISIVLTGVVLRPNM